VRTAARNRDGRRYTDEWTRTHAALRFNDWLVSRDETSNSGLACESCEQRSANGCSAADSPRAETPNYEAHMRYTADSFAAALQHIADSAHNETARCLASCISVTQAYPHGYDSVREAISRFFFFNAQAFERWKYNRETAELYAVRMQGWLESIQRNAEERQREAIKAAHEAARLEREATAQLALF
jgi:hypothetical protein